MLIPETTRQRGIFKKLSELLKDEIWEVILRGVHLAGGLHVVRFPKMEATLNVTSITDFENRTALVLAARG